MKKRLLFTLVTMVMALSAFAIEPGDYVFTKNARYKIMGENLLVNGQFDGFDGWNAINPDTASIDQVYSIETDAEVQGHTMKVNENMGGNFSMGMYQSVAMEPYETYIVSFKIRGLSKYTTNVIGGNYNFISAYGKTNAIPVTADSTDLSSYASNIGVTTEWQTISIPFVDTLGVDADRYLFIQFAGLAVGTEIAEVSINTALEVYDTRKAEKVISYAEMLLSKDFFTEMVQDLTEELEVTKDMLENDNDEMGDQVESLQTVIDMFIDENTEDYYEINYGAADSKNNDSPNWNQWTVSYNRAGLTSLCGWTFTGGNWGNRFDLDGDGNPDGVVGRPIFDGSLGYGQVYPDESEAHRTFNLPEGVWMTQVQAHGGHMSGYGSQGLSYVINPTDQCMYLTMFAGNDSTEANLLPTTEYDRFTQFFTLDKQQSIVMGYKITLDPAFSGQTTGGTVNLYYPVLRRVKGTSSGWSITELKLIQDVKNNLNDLNSQLKSAYNYLNNADYPWRKDSLQIGYETYKPMYDEWAALDEAGIVAKGAELIEEGTDFPTYIYNNATRMIREYFIKPFTDDNAPVVALKPYLDDAKATIADPANAKGDIATYQAAINAAQAAYDKCFTVPQKNYEDSLACREQIDLLIQAKMDFKCSIADKDNPAEIALVNGSLADHSGSKVSFKATGWDIVSEDSNGGWQSGYWYGHSSTDADAADNICINFNRGYSAAPLNKASQIITLKQPGYYTFVFKAYAYNCVESYDNKAVVYAKIWDPDWEEWVESTDSVDHYNGCQAFFGPNGTPDSIFVHKNPKAENLNGISLYCDGKSGTYMYSCPPDYYQMTIKKESSTEEQYELGISFMDNKYFCDGGFGNAKVYYTKDDYPYNPVIKQKADVVKGDANGDGVVDVSDITTIAAFILGKNPEVFNKANADVDGDGEITVSDITGTAGIILGK